jgi:hypothetical protein
MDTLRTINNIVSYLGHRAAKPGQAPNA